MERYLGIDWGEKRIGLACADEEIKLALPLGTVSNLAGVLQAASEEEITQIVIGLPYQMAGTDHKINDNFLKFVSALKLKTKIPVVEMDERLSSKAADALGGPKKIRAGRDEIAAALILQSYLDSK